MEMPVEKSVNCPEKGFVASGYSLEKVHEVME